MRLNRCIPGLLYGSSVARAQTGRGVSSPAFSAAVASAQEKVFSPQSIQDSIGGDGYTVRTYAWHDAQGEPRTVSLARSGSDPMGFFGGYIRNVTYVADGLTRECSSSNPDDPGFGFTVNHYIDKETGTYPSTSSRFFPAESDETYLAGRHHAIHQFKYNFTISGQPMATTIHYFFNSGRNNPVWAVTFDTSAAAPNSIIADTRAPYGDFDYDGGAGAVVAALGWGDHYKFLTTGDPVTANSGYCYNTPNVVPYAFSATRNPDAQMGWVQTQTDAQHDLGGYAGFEFWGQCAPNGPMPPPEAFPYQLNQYDLPYTNSSKRIATGANYGAVGQDAYLSYGNDRNLTGAPYQSYSVFIVLGLYRTQVVAQQVQEVETFQTAALSAGSGVTVPAAAPAGLSRPDLSRSGGPLGYNPIYGTWDLTAVANTSLLSWSLSVGEGQLTAPTFVVRNWTSQAPPITVTSCTTVLDADSQTGYLASVDIVRQTLWLTLGGSVFAGRPLVLAVTADLAAQAPRPATPPPASGSPRHNAAAPLKARCALVLAAAAAVVLV